MGALTQAESIIERHTAENQADDTMAGDDQKTREATPALKPAVAPSPL